MDGFRLAALSAFVFLSLSAGFAARSGPAVATGNPVAPSSERGIAGWTSAGTDEESTLTAGEGVATVSQPHQSEELYRGIESIPNTLKSEGWGHIGDPDSIHGYVFDAYQGPGSGNSKMFLVTTPEGKVVVYVHRLVPRELYNNSFAAVSPDDQWMVAGEWETMSHLQIYPTPILNRRTAPNGGSLKLAGFIKLDHMVNDIQGCDFVTPLTLICASDDDSRTLFANEKPLVEIQLTEALHGRSVRGHVVDLGSIPQSSICSGTFEAEGVDFDDSTGVLRVEIIQPGSCILKTTILEYERASRHH